MSTTKLTHFLQMWHLTMKMLMTLNCKLPKTANQIFLLSYKHRVTCNA